MSNLTAIFQATNGLSTILGKITNPLVNYCRLIWSNSQINGVSFVLFAQTATPHIFSFNSFSSALAIIVISGLIGLALGLLVSLIILIVERIRYQFFYKKQLPNHTWKDYLAYRQNPRIMVRTRGGQILVEDMLSSIDVEQIYEGLRPLKPIERVARDCFKWSGWYLVNKKWKSLIKALKRYGLIRKILTIFGFHVNKVALETFLLHAYKEIDSLPMVILFSTNYFDGLVLAIHDYSKTKIIFNSVTLFFIALGSAAFTAGLTSSFILGALGFGASTPAMFALWLVEYAAPWTVLSSSTIYYAGQFIPPQDCEQFAKRLAESKVTDMSKETLTEAANTALIHVSESDISEFRSSYQLPTPDINAGINSKTDNNIISAGTENTANGLKTLGDLESDELSLIERYQKTLWNRQELWKKPVDMNDFDDIPVQKPIYNRLREGIVNLLF